MPVPPIDATAGTYGIFAPSTASAADTASTKADQQQFLQLMVAQLRYQDPMNPTDSSQFLAQNATFTQVQAIQEMQQEMEMALSAQLAFGATAMIGKQVSWIDAAGVTQSGTVDGTTFTSSGPVLSVGNESVALNAIATVSTDTTTA